VLLLVCTDNNNAMFDALNDGQTLTDSIGYTAARAPNDRDQTAVDMRNIE